MIVKKLTAFNWGKHTALNFDCDGSIVGVLGPNGSGKSTLAARKLWFDDKFGRLNTESKGQYLGNFEDDNLIVIYQDGSYELTDTELQQFGP